MSRTVRLVTVVAFALAALPALAQVPNWPAPATWTPPRPAGFVHAMGDVTSPLPFSGVTPCRIVDTRGANGTFGGPKLVAGAARNFPLVSGPCTGIPTGVDAYSLNITVTEASGTGFILIYPQGGAQPVVSTLNYVAGQTIANAAIVPAGTGGGVTVVAGVAGTHLIIDINGYYSDTPGDPSRFFSLSNNSSGYTMYLDNNSTTCSGPCGLYATTSSGHALYGYAAAAAGGFGVFGTTAGSGLDEYGVYGSSTNAVGVKGLSSNSNGIWADSTNYDALYVTGGRHGAYIEGDQNGSYSISLATTGVQYGLLGIILSGSNRAAGVYGLISGLEVNPTNDYGRGGVIGNLADGIAVVGLTSGSGWGVAGFHYNQQTGGTLQTAGYLGFSSTSGVHAVGNITATGTKSFVEPHPYDSSKAIVYIALEGNEAGTYFRGKGRFTGRTAVIDVPEDFRFVTDTEGLSIQVTPIGDLATVAVVSIGLDEIVLKSSRDVEFFYTVNGVRRAYRDVRPIVDNEKYYVPESASAVMPEGLAADVKARLVANGTYNPDGTVNMATAERAGWAQAWRDKAEAERLRVQEAEAQKAAKDAELNAIRASSAIVK